MDMTFKFCIDICSINTAWLSVAASVAALVVPASYGVTSQMDWLAVSLAAVFTVIGASISTGCSHFY